MTADEKTISERIKGKFGNVRDALSDFSDRWTDKQNAQIRAKWLPRWAEISGLQPDENGEYDYDKIDYENPFILLEWYMCDPAILFNLGNKDRRAKQLAKLPEKCQEAYFMVGPGNDKPYSEVYTGTSQLAMALKGGKKRKK